MKHQLHDNVFREKYRGKGTEKRTAYFFDAFYKNLADSPALREAKALLAQWEQIEIRVYPEELLVGHISDSEIADFHYGDGVSLHWDRIEAMGQGYAEKAKEIQAQIYNNPYQPGFQKGLYTPEEETSIQTSAASSTWFGGHLSMDYESILTLGLKGYGARITGEGDFYEAMRITLNAFRRLIIRTGEQCKTLCMERQAKALLRIAEEPPASFFEALELTLMVHICSNADSFGRIDSYLRPFFERDLARGAITQEEVFDLFCSLIVKIEEQEQIQNMTIGGILPDNSSNYTELTELMLKATKEMGYKGPNLCLRVHPCMPAHFWELALDCMSTGQGLPALYNDEVVIPALETGGYPIELCRDYCLGGCSQIMFGGRCQFVNDIGMMNIAKILELTLLSGEVFSSYERLQESFISRLIYYVRLETSINNKDILDRGMREGYCFRSLLTRGCLETGKGIFEGGPLYQNVQLECIGITNAADSLYAVKKSVFEDQRISYQELISSMKKNYEGAESLQHYLLSLAKFGNDRQEVDDIRAEITGILFRALRAQEGPFGGHYVPGEVIFTAHEHCGAAVGATPDGRRAGEVLADSAGSQQGRNMLGPTALMNSVQKIPIEGMITSIVLNMKFHRAFFNAHRALIAALFQTHFAAGGQQLQINVCDNEELKLALLHPERYQDLVVRVGGYSDYFVRLNRRLQEDIISRGDAVI